MHIMSMVQTERGRGEEDQKNGGGSVALERHVF